MLNKVSANLSKSQFQFCTSDILTGRSIKLLCWGTRWLCTSPTWSRSWSTSASCWSAPTPPGSSSMTGSTRTAARLRLISQTPARSDFRFMKMKIINVYCSRLSKIFALMENVQLMEKNVRRICTMIKPSSVLKCLAITTLLWLKKVYYFVNMRLQKLI